MSVSPFFYHSGNSEIISKKRKRPAIMYRGITFILLTMRFANDGLSGCIIHVHTFEERCRNRVRFKAEYFSMSIRTIRRKIVLMDQLDGLTVNLDFLLA